MITEREVDPYGITRSQSAWYFYGYCHLRQDMRSFRLDRVESLIVTRKSFSIRDTIDAGTRLNDQQIIELRVKPEAVRWVRERQHYAFVSEETIGQNTIMTYQVKEFTEIRAWILAWGASVEVLKPVVLRDEIFSEVEAILQFRNSSETS
jgi:predicted DNA-binding transcriptional regulator YafY